MNEKNEIYQDILISKKNIIFLSFLFIIHKAYYILYIIYLLDSCNL